MSQATQVARAERSECKTEESPFLAEFFVVEGPGYRCLAYHDGEGRWRKAFSHIVLPGKIRIIE